MVQKIRIHSRNVDDSYELIYPETVAEMIIVDMSTGKTLADVLTESTVGSDVHRLVEQSFIIAANMDNQTDYTFNDPAFNSSTDEVIVHFNGEYLHADDYTVNTVGGTPKVVLSRSVITGDKVHITVRRMEKTNVNVAEKIGDVSSLQTSQKTIVGAINEVSTVWD